MRSALLALLLCSCANGYHLECYFDDDAGGVLVCHQVPNEIPAGRVEVTAK